MERTKEGYKDMLTADQSKDILRYSAKIMLAGLKMFRRLHAVANERDAGQLPISQQAFPREKP